MRARDSGLAALTLYFCDKAVKLLRYRCIEGTNVKMELTGKWSASSSSLSDGGHSGISGLDDSSEWESESMFMRSRSSTAPFASWPNYKHTHTLSSLVSDCRTCAQAHQRGDMGWEGESELSRTRSVAVWTWHGPTIAGRKGRSFSLRLSMGIPSKRS